MTSYFPLPEDFSLDKNQNISVEGSVTIHNYINNASLKSLKNLDDKKDIYCSLYYLKYPEWVKISDTLCVHDQFIEFKRSQIDIPENSMAVIVNSLNKANPEKTKYLPKPFSLRIDKSPIDIRASYNFKLQNTICSYQGEFPEILVNLRKTTLLSFDYLRLDDNSYKESWVMMMNLNSNAQNNSLHEIKFFDPKNNQYLQSIMARSNSFCAYKLPDINLKSQSNSKINLFLSCKTAGFIPIFINTSITLTKSEIDVEHTHPPHEMFVGYNRNEAVKRLRNIWL